MLLVLFAVVFASPSSPTLVEVFEFAVVLPSLSLDEFDGLDPVEFVVFEAFEEFVEFETGIKLEVALLLPFAKFSEEFGEVAVVSF
mmetsp:Transcript_17532/g.27033  ORF Transcript_17532/g.27033 Transcript_17532/m.27033 type:complete len:86 (+) Transcript_17532:2057-2314(+)